MKSWFSLLILVSLVQVGSAAPLRLHNRIVFTRGNWARGAEAVWTMNAEGGEQKCVWHVPKGYGRFGGFSRDGKLGLSFNGFNLYVHNLQTKKLRGIFSWNGGFGSYIATPSFSADGKQVLCEAGGTSVSSSDTHIFKISVQKRSLKGESINEEIVPISADVATNNLWSAPCWSHKGKQIIAIGGPSFPYTGSVYPADAQTEIWMMNADGTGALQVTNNPAWDISPAWSETKGTIVFIRRLNTDHSNEDVYSFNLWLVDANNHTEQQLTSNPQTYEEMFAQNAYVSLATPLFSPTGTQIAFEKSVADLRGFDPAPSEGIYRIDLDDKSEKRLSDGHLIQWVP